MKRIPGALPFLLASVVLPPVLGRAGLLTEYWAYMAGLAAAYAAAALSLNLLMGYAGQISLGQFALLGVGAFTSGVITGPDKLALPFALAVPAAAVMGGLIAFLIGLPALRLRGLYLAVVTIAFNFAMEHSIFRAEFISGGSAGVALPRPLAGTFAFSRDVDYLAVALVLLIAIWQIDVNVTRSKLGRAFQAIRADETIAASFAVDVRRYKLFAFVLSGAVAGVAGVMFGHLSRFVNSESFSYSRSLMLVIIVVIGGLGSRVGVLISSLFYALFPVLVIEWFGEGFRGWDLILGAVLLMYTLAKHPGGLAEAIQEARHKKEVKEARRHQEDAEVEQPTMPKLPELPRPTGLPARPATTSDVVLRATDITVRFGGLQAVDSASIAVPRNKIVGLIGPNGAGKTTLFNAISGALKPDSGRVELLGQDVSDLPAHERARLGMGRTFQLIGLAKDLSVTENLLLAQHAVAGYSIPSALTRIGKAPRIERELRDRAADTIHALGFSQYADTPVKRLSHGQQRIVEIGCALITAPEVVMLDEPSAGMAPGAAENLAVRLRDMRDELGRTILLIEHNIPLVLDVCDELYVLSSGGVLAAGKPDEVVSRDDVITAYLGETYRAPVLEEVNA